MSEDQGIPVPEEPLPAQSTNKDERPSRHIRRKGKIKGFHVGPKVVNGRIPFWTDIQRDAMRLLDVDQRVQQYGPCTLPPVKVEVEGKPMSYQALLTVNLIRTIVVFDIVRTNGTFADMVRRAYAAHGYAYAFIEEARVRQDPAFSNALEIENARCVEVPESLALFTKQALGRGIKDMSGLEAALANWQASRPLPRGGRATSPRMLAYALFLHRHIRFDPFTEPVTGRTAVSL